MLEQKIILAVTAMEVYKSHNVCTLSQFQCKEALPSDLLRCLLKTLKRDCAIPCVSDEAKKNLVGDNAT